MIRELTYKGFVCLNGDDYLLVIKRENKFYTIPISGNKDILSDVKDKLAVVVAIKFFDGTELIDLNRCLDIIDEVFISITVCAKIKISAELGVYDIIHSSYDDTLKMWEFVDDYFNTKIGIKRFNEVINKKIF